MNGNKATWRISQRELTLAPPWEASLWQYDNRASRFDFSERLFAFSAIMYARIEKTPNRIAKITAMTCKIAVQIAWLMIGLSFSIIALLSVRSSARIGLRERSRWHTWGVFSWTAGSNMVVVGRGLESVASSYTLVDAVSSSFGAVEAMRTES
jgi:hypothetical protein